MPRSRKAQPEEKFHKDNDSNKKTLLQQSQELSTPLLSHDLSEPQVSDVGSIALLLLLYVLQGIPLGLAGSIPYLLQSRNITYAEQATYSFVFWPFSLKLLWAPLVDALYFKGFGRRKSWLVPIQYLLGVFMYVLSGHVSELLGDDLPTGDHVEHPPVKIVTLTCVFFALNFFAATQDIAVDGWALTMLSRRNVGWASTSNTVGQTAGYFMGYVVFLALESPEFCNGYLRTEPQPQGIVTFSNFLYFWSIVFLVTTTLVMLFKSEKPETASFNADGVLEKEPGITETYHILWKIIRLPAVMSFIGILLTCKIGFAAADAITGLKLIEEGVPKEKLALLGVPMMPIQIILPLIISKYTTGPKPMDIFMKAMPFRLLMGLVFAGIVWWAPSTRNEDGEYPLYFYVVVLGTYALHQVMLYCMFTAIMGFHAKISDPAVGGTYMTLLNTVTNLGGNWPSTLALYFVDMLTWRHCSGKSGAVYNSLEEAQAASADVTEDDITCTTYIDGYYVESIICVVLGFLWIMWRADKVKHLQSLNLKAWHFAHRKSKV